MDRRNVIAGIIGISLAGCLDSLAGVNSEDASSNSSNSTVEQTDGPEDSSSTKKPVAAVSYLVAAGWFEETPDGVNRFPSDEAPIRDHEKLQATLDAAAEQNMRESGETNDSDSAEPMVSEIFTEKPGEDVWRSMRNVIEQAGVEYDSSNGRFPGYFFDHNDKPIAVDFIKES
jgi:hypothetical protein